MSFFISKELEGIVTKETLYEDEKESRVKITNLTKDIIKKFDFIEYDFQKNKLKLQCRSITLADTLDFFSDVDNYKIDFLKKTNQKIRINKIKSKNDLIVINFNLFKNENKK